MGKLDKLTGSCGGYFRSDCEDEFPWDATSGIWYSLLVVEDGKIEKYGFTSAKGSKATLSAVLKELDPADDTMLIGVWNGQWKTHLFILDVPTAIEKLDKLQ